MKMITASIGSHRFESGPTYHFNGSDFGELSSVVLDPTATVDYVNALSGVNATPEEIRDVAASGIARIAIRSSEMSLLTLASGTFIDAVGGTPIDQAIFANAQSGRWDNREDLFGTALSNEALDSASVLATRRNNEEVTAKLIREAAPTDEGYFVIALANGGLISAARTYLRLGKGNHEFGMVSYSRVKKRHTVPNLMPYPTDRQRWFKQRAEGRQVVVLDEDYATGETLKTATKFFAGLLGTTVTGIAPVELGRRIEYRPLVIASEQAQN